MDGYVGFHAALRNAYGRFIKDLAKQCKQLVRHHLDSVTSPYSMVCYENDIQGVLGSSAASFFHKLNQASLAPFSFDLSDVGVQTDTMKDQENVPPENSVQQTTPGKGAEAREALRESQMTVPETPSPDQPSDAAYGGAKDLGNGVDVAGKKRLARMGNSRNSDRLRVQNGGNLKYGNGDNGSRSSSAYTDVCSCAAQHFSRIREVLVERSVTSTLNSGFLSPW